MGISAERKYALAALDAEAAKVASAGEGDRNNALNTAAFCLGTIIPNGGISDSEVEGVLTDAALRAGLRPHEIATTLKSEITAGMRNPRRPLPARSGAMTYRFTDRDFPVNGKKPRAFYDWKTDRRSAWWAEFNRRAAPNGEAGPNEEAPTPVRAKGPRAGLGTGRRGAKNSEIPPYGNAEASAEDRDFGSFGSTRNGPFSENGQEGPDPGAPFVPDCWSALLR